MRLLRLALLHQGRANAVPLIKTAIAQPLNKVTTIPRATRRSVQHLALSLIDLLRCSELLGEAPGAFPGAVEV